MLVILTDYFKENIVLSYEAIAKISSHPAFEGLDSSILSEINEKTNMQLAAQSVGNLIHFGFEPFVEAKPSLRKVLLSYEITAASNLEMLNNVSPENKEIREQVIAASFKAFEILRLYPIPKSRDEQIQFVFRIAPLAYCGERWSDLGRWFSDNSSIVDATPLEQKSWDKHILSHLYFCWTRLFRKDSRTDLDQILETISKLQLSQDEREKQFFDELATDTKQVSAIRLVVLYYLAKCTEIVTKFLLTGESDGEPLGQIDMYFERATEAAKICGERQIEYILAWLHPTSRIMITSSLWWRFRTSDPKTNQFVKILTNRKSKPIFDLLPPQQLAISKGLLDPLKTAVVVDMPTSGGKTLLAQFKILQTLNYTAHENGWVAYLTPTRALSSQITRRLRKDFNELEYVVEQLTGALDINVFEDELLVNSDKQFDILVTTPEKFQQVVRNKKIEKRPPALVVLDEAHNIEAEERGLRIELLLATLKQEFPKTNFLLLMPFAEGTKSLANWLAGDQFSSLPISTGTTPWKPNERIIGLFSAVEDNEANSSWHLEFEPLEATEKAIALTGKFKVGSSKPINIARGKVISKKKQIGYSKQAVAMSTIMSENGTSIAIGQDIPTVWNMADLAYNNLPNPKSNSTEIKLVQDYLQTEVGLEFDLVNYLSKRVAVHHSGLSDEVRSLIEWLAETGQLNVLCATTTIAQGLNFPVSSVFLQSYKFQL